MRGLIRRLFILSRQSRGFRCLLRYDVLMCFCGLRFFKYEKDMRLIGRPDSPVVKISDCLSDDPSSILGQVVFY